MNNTNNESCCLNKLDKTQINLAVLLGLGGLAAFLGLTLSGEMQPICDNAPDPQEDPEGTQSGPQTSDACNCGQLCGLLFVGFLFSIGGAGIGVIIPPGTSAICNAASNACLFSSPEEQEHTNSIVAQRYNLGYGSAT